MKWSELIKNKRTKQNKNSDITILYEENNKKNKQTKRAKTKSNNNNKKSQTNNWKVKRSYSK